MFEVEQVACGLCGMDDPVVLKRQTRSVNLPPPLQIVRCLNCGLVYMNPRPTLLAFRDMYEGTKFYQEYPQRVAKRAHLFPQTYEAIEKLKPQKGRLLELGPATGEFLIVGRDRGWNVVGIDTSQSLASIARSKYGLEIIVAPSITEANIPDVSFDVVYASHVLEHLPSPSITLRDMYRILKPDGLAVVQVPNEFEDLTYIFFRWLATNRFRRPEATVVDHVYFFSPQTLKAMMEEQGFCIVDISTWRNRNRRNFLESRYPVGRFAKRVIYPVGGLFGRGPNIEIIATKR